MTRIARRVELDRRGGLRTILEPLEVCRGHSKRRLRLSLDLDQTRTVHGDARRLEQVFWNLLNNAVKFAARR